MVEQSRTAYGAPLLRGNGLVFPQRRLGCISRGFFYLVLADFSCYADDRGITHVTVYLAAGPRVACPPGLSLLSTGPFLHQDTGPKHLLLSLGYNKTERHMPSVMAF